ncbi:MAG: hypothetical protein J5836_00135 [Clostridia bacterium]|nr:hypothetical protein [Clostridia bacterium]
MQYKVYCLLKSDAEKDRVLRVKVIADCISDALNKAKEMFSRKLNKRNYNIFMYETAK